MNHRVVFSPEALLQLTKQQDYLAEKVSAAFAAKHIEAIVVYCEGFSLMPERGTRHDEVRPGLRVVSRGRADIAFAVSPAEVAILGVFFNGQDYEAVLGD
jgi:toxin ParE1/3/4